MNFLRRAMIGRNGIDHLTVAILLLGLILNLIGTLAGIPVLANILWTVNYACLVLAIYRTISRNIYRRQSENRKFLAVFGRVKGWFGLRIRMIREVRGYKYLKCPSCKQRLRVPRGKGRIRVSCAKCMENFERKV